jgi:hypothetical protein
MVFAYCFPIFFTCAFIYGVTALWFKCPHCNKTLLLQGLRDGKKEYGTFTTVIWHATWTAQFKCFKCGGHCAIAPRKV